MKLTFLGTGSAFTTGTSNYHSNMILENEHGKLLIDCGSDIRFSLYDSDLSYQEIQDVYISHLHADHVGGLEWLSFSTYFDPACAKPTLYASHSLVSDLWDHVLSGGLRSLQDKEAELATYFNVHAIAADQQFIWQDTLLKLIPTTHIINNHHIVPSFGLWFKADYLTVFITTDTQFTPLQMDEYYQSADIIFHDCETASSKSGVHAHYTELVQLDPKIKAKMWLYHYQPGALPEANKDGFRGFVKKGQSFNFADLSTL